MRVAAKLVGFIILILVSIRAIEGVATVQRETARLNADVRRDAELMDQMLGTLVGAVWQEQGRGRAMRMIEGLNVEGHPMRISWLDFGEADPFWNRVAPSERRRLQAGERVLVLEPASRYGALQHVLIPLRNEPGKGVIQITEALAERSRYVDRALLREALAGTAVVIIGGGGILIIGFMLIGRPLEQLRSRVESIGEGNLSDRLPETRRDEFGELAKGLNRMCRRLTDSQERARVATEKRLAAVEQMRHADRLATIGRLASGVAHELGTPLNVVCGRASMIEDDPSASERTRNNAKAIAAQGDRMTTIIRNLLDFARHRTPDRVAMNVMPVVRQAVELVASLGEKRGVRVEPAGEEPRMIASLDAGQIQQVLINLVENALHASPPDGEVLVTVASVVAKPPANIDSPAPRYLRIDVLDHGVGMAPETVQSIFDPFFTMKEPGKGTGLGLSIAFGIVRDHSGWIDVQSELGKGTRFSVYLPQDEAS